MGFLRKSALVICAFPTLFQAAPCAIHTQCWLLCHCPPHIVSAGDAVGRLRETANRRLRGFARVAGILTTPLAKNIGIRGWRDYCLDVEVTGQVWQVARSWDGYETVDIALERFGSAGDPANLVAGRHKFIRLELRRAVRKGMRRNPAPGDRVEVRGHLLWDGDGFLEVHPLQGGSVHVL